MLERGREGQMGSNPLSRLPLEYACAQPHRVTRASFLPLAHIPWYCCHLRWQHSPTHTQTGQSDDLKVLLITVDEVKSGPIMVTCPIPNFLKNPPYNEWCGTALRALLSCLWGTPQTSGPLGRAKHFRRMALPLPCTCQGLGQDCFTQEKEMCV